ncbi:MAG: hypothetical protein ACKV2T_20615 [Kofleriaceae bacterium]
MFRAHRIERRLLEAVLLTLASAGCQPPPASPAEPAPPVHADGGRSMIVPMIVPTDAAGPDVAVSELPAVVVADAGAPTTVDAPVATAPVVAVPPPPPGPDADAMCQAHKLCGRMAADDRTELARARDTARAELRASLADVSPVPSLGIPGGLDAVALFDAYFA